MSYLTSTLRQALAKTTQWTGMQHTNNKGNPFRDFIFTSFCECDQFFFIGTNHGLFLKNKRDGSLQFLHPQNSKLPDDHVTSLACTKEGLTYIGTRKGLLQWHSTKTFLFTTLNSTIPDNHITALAMDTENDLWIGTSEGGLAKSKGRINNILTIEPVDSANKNIYSLSVDPTGYVWVTFQDGEFTYFDLCVSTSYVPRSHERKESFLLKTPHEGTFLTDGILFEELCFNNTAGKISCAYYNPKYSRMILCDVQGINIFRINDPWSGYRHSSYSSFIKSISKRGHCQQIEQILQRIMKSEQEPFVDLSISSPGAWR